MRILDWEFDRVGRIMPLQTATGKVVEYRPQDRFANLDGLRVHQHGSGPFCRFALPEGSIRGVGVYAFVVDGEIVYIGECEDLRGRINTGYGHISPRNCFVGGQSTNCRVNNLVYNACSAGKLIDLFFHPTRERFGVEDALIARLSPPWNRQRGRPTRGVAIATSPTLDSTKVERSPSASSCALVVRAAAEVLAAGRQDGCFTVAEILGYLRTAGTHYSASTIRTHVVSVCCQNAPQNHAVRYPFFERVGRGLYRLVR